MNHENKRPPKYGVILKTDVWHEGNFFRVITMKNRLADDSDVSITRGYFTTLAWEFDHLQEEVMGSVCCLADSSNKISDHYAVCDQLVRTGKYISGQYGE